jgi:glucosamine kinase
VRTTLAVDIGQTAARVLLTHADGRVERRHGAAGRAGETAEDALVAIVADVVGTSAAIDTVSAGLTGLQGRPGRAADVLAELSRRCRIGRVVLADDALTSYVGALGLRPGVVVAAGTGAVTLATDGSRRHARVDGWGYLVGDLGSGYWIGRRGIEAALRAVDGRDGSPGLQHLARSTYGELETLPQRLAADPDRVRLVARFAEPLAEAARSGNESAAQIWREAAGHLADAAAAACRQVGLAGTAVEVSWAGRLFAAGAVLTEPFAAALETRLPGATLTAPAADALDGAHTLATLDHLPGLYPLLTSAVATAVADEVLS